jgi:hypothetical protein
MKEGRYIPVFYLWKLLSQKHKISVWTISCKEKVKTLHSITHLPISHLIYTSKIREKEFVDYIIKQDGAPPILNRQEKGARRIGDDLREELRREYAKRGGRTA